MIYPAPHFRISGLILVLVAMLAGSAAAQQSDGRHMREFQRKFVPTPEELIRELSQARLEAPVGTPMFDQLQKVGMDIFQSLPKEEQERARQFAEQLLKSKGFDSREAQGLMERMGVPKELQQQLAEQFRADPGSLDPAPWERAFNDETLRQGMQQLGLGDGPREARNPSSQPGTNQPVIEGNDLPALPWQGLPLNRPPAGDNRTAPNPGRPAGSDTPIDEDWAEQFSELARGAVDRLSQSESNLQKRIESLSSAKADSAGPDAGSGSAWSRLMENGSKLLNGADNSGKPSEKLEARFDRLLFEAAKRSLDAPVANGQGNAITESVDSALDKVIAQLAETVRDHRRKAREEQAKAPKQNPRPTSVNRPGGAGPSTSDIASSAGPGTDAPSNSGTASSGSGGLFEVARNARMDPGLLLFGVALLLAAGGLILWFVRYRIPAMSPRLAQRQLIRRLKHFAIRSPRDLVDAVDLFLIATFGSKSNWWAARHAEAVVSAAAPADQAAISTMFRAYERSRYAADGDAVPPGDQQVVADVIQQLSGRVTELKPHSSESSAGKGDSE